MSFNLFEVWKSDQPAGDQPRRGVLTVVDSDGLKGGVLFDNGETNLISWPPLGWQRDTAPKPTRSADELKQLILRQMQLQPVCPEGMSVEIRGKGDTDWEALSVPPPGTAIGYADCADYTSKLARAYRALYALRRAEESISGQAGEFIRFAESFDQQSFGQQGSRPVPRVIEATIEEGMVLSDTMSVERRLSERPLDIREAARALSRAISDQIEDLNASRLNDPAAHKPPYTCHRHSPNPS
jgi:hypothetical protein